MISIGSYICTNGGISSYIHMDWIFSGKINFYPVSNHQPVERELGHFILNCILIGIRPGLSFQNTVSFGSIAGSPIRGWSIGVKC